MHVCECLNVLEGCGDVSEFVGNKLHINSICEIKLNGEKTGEKRDVSQNEP